MTTEDLIASLSAESQPVRPQLLRQSVLLGLAMGLGVTVAAFATFWGLRGDFATSARPFLPAKSALPLSLAAAALPLTVACARPGATSRAAGWVWAVLFALAGVVVLTFALTPPARWTAEFMGNSARVCLTSIPILSAPILAGLLSALRRGAPERPARLGAVAGLVAGGVGAGVYSLYCTEDSPLFYGVWYGLAIGIVTAAGAALGARVLRW